MIRKAVKVDVEIMVEMGMRFISETSYKDRIMKNPAHLCVTLHGLIGIEDGLLLVSESSGLVNGAIGAVIYDHPLSGERVASELFWWVNPESRGSHGPRLLKAAEAWAISRGARKMQMVAPNEHVEKFYNRIGYERVETMYQRNLAW